MLSLSGVEIGMLKLPAYGEVMAKLFSLVIVADDETDEDEG